MQLATCSYSAWRPDMGTAVRITLGSPRRPPPPGREHWIFVAELAPRPSYFRASPGEFERAYLDQLAAHADGIERKLGWIAEAHPGPLVLCCFERRVSGPADCHRRRFADWWAARTGQEVPELDPAKEAGPTERNHR